jgi:hypothetical protein
MKKIMLTFAVLMGVSAATTTYASDGIIIVKVTNTIGELNITAFDGLKFRLTIQDLEKKTSIAIKNAAGELFYNEFVSKVHSFNKVYNLSNLPDGDYFFEVIIGNEKQIKPFKIETKINRTAISN